MKKAIAMKCSQEQFEAVKGKFEGIDTNPILRYSGSEDSYLTNDYNGEKEVSFTLVRGKREIHETWNEKVFLEACGIDTEKDYRITKEQLQTIEADGCTYVKEWFPEAFKKLFTGWAKCTGYGNEKWIGRFEKDVFEYGIGSDGKWFKKEIEKHNFNMSDGFVVATNQEIETALIAEAKKRGFKRGVWANRSQEMLNKYNTPSVKKEILIEQEEFEHGDILNELTLNGRLIFIQGIWAEIIPTITKSEAKKKIGGEN